MSTFAEYLCPCIQHFWIIGILQDQGFLSETQSATFRCWIVGWCSLSNRPFDDWNLAFLSQLPDMRRQSGFIFVSFVSKRLQMIPITFLEGIFDQAKIKSVFIWVVGSYISPIYQRLKEALTIEGATVSISTTAITISLGDGGRIKVPHDLCIMSGNEGTDVFSTRI